jgi:sodium/hydrogen exchanger family protein/integrase-like protein
MVGDITYIPTWQGWVYLATVIDCHTKAIIGWAMDDNYKTPLIENAIRMAARNYELPPDATVLVAALVVLVIAIVGKFAGAYLGGRMSRLSHRECLALGAGMNARGVVEVIVALAGLRLGVLTTATYTIIVLVAVVTSLMAPPLLARVMAGIDHTAEERLRELDHAKWSGAAEPARSVATGR